MLTNSQKEHLTYTAIWQVAALAVLGIIGYSYIFANLDKIDENVTKANENIEKYQHTELNGLSFEEVSEFIGKKPEYSELLKIMNADVAGTKEVLVKDAAAGDKKYLEWIKESIGRSSEEREAISQYKKKLNSILPTLSPVSGNIDEENITLKGYVRFIETQILKRFNFDSNIVLGMDGITLGQWTDGVPENIGTFDLQISFNAKNKDITNFIDFINTTGNPDLLTSSGILSKADIPAVMSNPLITLVNFWLENYINEKDPDSSNSWRATIRFYVRWASKDDVVYVRENIKVREDDLEAALVKSIDECSKKWPLCGELQKQLETFSRKFQEYKSGTSGSNVSEWESVSQIYVLSQKVNTLRTLEQEYQKIIVPTNN